MLLELPSRLTECGNRWSPASVDEFNRTAEKYYRYGSIVSATVRGNPDYAPVEH